MLAHLHIGHDHAGHGHSGHGHEGPGGGRTHGARDRRDERRRLAAALLFTATILVVELIGGLISGSLALISDAGHMFVDSVSLLLSFIAIGVASRPVNGRYTYGFRRVEILAGLLNGVTLLFVCAWIVWEGVQRLMHPREIDSALMLGIALIGITANIVSALLLRRATSLNVRSAFLHVLGDLFSSVGIVIAALCMMVWEVPWLDPALSIAIAVIVLIGAYRLTSEALGVLMEAAPSGIDTERIRTRLLQEPGVRDVHELHVWTITSGLPALSCHVIVDPAASGAETEEGGSAEAGGAAQPGTSGGADGTAKASEASGAPRTPGDATDLLVRLEAVLAVEFDIAHSTIQIETPAYSTRPGGPCASC